MVFDEGSAAPIEGKLLKKKQSKRETRNKREERRSPEAQMESLARMNEREKVGIEGVMIGEGTVRGREIEREETQGRGSEIEI